MRFRYEPILRCPSTLAEIRWGWFSDHKNQPQLETYPTADAALKAMRQRHASDCDWSVEDFAEQGFHLARVRVMVTPIAILTKVK